MSYNLISSGKTVFGRSLGKRDMVFCIFYCDEAKPYENYDYFLNSKNPEERAKANLNVPLVLAQFRWDGKTGFVGGHVEAHHNSLMEALHDELIEEIGLDVFVAELEQVLEPHATFENEKGTIYISSYLWKVDYKTIVDLALNAKNGKDFIAENCGNFLIQIHKDSVDNVLSQSFSGTAKLELEKLITDKLLLDKCRITDVQPF